MDHLPVIRPTGEHQSQDRQPLFGVDGHPLVEVSHAPPLLVGRVLRQLRPVNQERLGEIPAILAEAGRMVATATIAGETPEEYVRRHCLATGVPVAVARGALPALERRLAGLPAALAAQRPVGIDDRVRWVRRARTLGVVAPNNHPLTHLAWLQALAAGYAVAVRPGGKDPFTPIRLVRALLKAGLPAETLAVLPGPHSTAQAVLTEADLGLVYGDDSTVAAYRGSSRHLVRGPGRTKALLLAGFTPDESGYHDLVSAVAGDAGVRCTNVSTLLVEGDHTAVAENLARRLCRLPSLPVTDSDAVLPVYSVRQAEALRRSVGRLASGVTDVTAALGEPDLVTVGDDQVVMRPAVLTVDRAEATPGAELPFPCVWVAPWHRSDGLAALRDSLVVRVFGPDSTRLDPLISRLLDEPTIRGIILGGGEEWLADPLLPHDGYLSQFLLEARTLATGGGQ